MKKYSLLFIYFCIFFACEKVSANILDSTQYFEQKICEFYIKKMAGLTPEDATKAKETLSKLDFSLMRKEDFPQTGDLSFKLDILLVPTRDIDVHNFIGNKERRSDPEQQKTSVKTNFMTKAVFYILTDQSILDGNLVEISSANYSSTDIDKYFTDIIRVKRKDFTGHLNINSFSQRLLNDYACENGNPISSTVIALKRPTGPNGDETSRNDWYLETSYFGAYSSRNKESRFLYSTNKSDFRPSFE